MSAFIVSPHHIDTLVSWAVANCLYGLNDRSPQELAEILYNANVDSVDYRYNETNRRDYKFCSLPLRGLTCVQIIKACDCLDYQCCEVPDWGPKHLAYNVIRTIREEAIRRLPGYSQAKWALDERSTA